MRPANGKRGDDGAGTEGHIQGLRAGSRPRGALRQRHLAIEAGVLALGILAMSVALIRSETASDLRTLTASGAAATTRRTLTATTAGALALLGTAAAYVAAVGYSWANPLDGLGSLSSGPTVHLLIILVGMPLAAALAGWLLVGREPAALGRQPME